MAISKNVNIHYHLQPNLPEIEADNTQIQQVFVNLIINASEAIEEANNGPDAERSITVETKNKTLDTKYFEQTITRDPLPKGDYVIVRITDTGTGIDNETVAHIFDPFFTTKFTGRGLGLAAVLGIIRGHRGSITVTSQIGHGTCFELAFPRLAAQSKEPRFATQAPPHIGAGTILIADDEPAVLKAGGRLLKKLGYSILEVNNGQKAIEMVQDLPDSICCAILDITMPGTGGIAAMTEIQRINPALPVILTSGYSQEQAIDENSKAKPTAFLQKPYNMDTLERLIHRVLEKTTD